MRFNVVEKKDVPPTEHLDEDALTKGMWHMTLARIEGALDEEDEEENTEPEHHSYWIHCLS